MPPVTEYRVLMMISEALEKYDVKQQKRYEETTRKQDERHKENTTALAELKEAMDESHGIKKLLAWGIPVIVSILMIVAEWLRQSK